ncbi:hypothetical protein [Helicobacter cappadocius]|uniref:Poly E-rich protein n=1 Tax=Helicobacter cappadocius TaxID=3063998 RepID=A0AA90PJ48_9HELI|nr:MULTISPECIES: hypothetical protein [unclassified Helicobacter]MDO7253363.1 hypothetical protein [Helicobacter sp. faydin-H75]MDP2539207.1 hypothetical protein [Helicobacter sp. faydin-H76]
MKILLINNDSMVKKLFEAVAKKLGLDLIAQDSLKLPNAEDEFFLFLDDGVAGEYSELLQSPKILIKVYLHKRTSSPADGFEFYIKKPFLPTEVLDILKSRLADFGIDESTTSNLTKDDLAEIPEHSLAIDDFDLDELDDLDFKDADFENQKGPSKPIPHISDDFDLSDLEEIQGVLDDLEKEKDSGKQSDSSKDSPDEEDSGFDFIEVKEDKPDSPKEQTDEIEEQPDIDEILKNVKSSMTEQQNQDKEEQKEADTTVKDALSELADELNFDNVLSSEESSISDLQKHKNIEEDIHEDQINKKDDEITVDESFQKNEENYSEEAFGESSSILDKKQIDEVKKILEETQDEENQNKETLMATPQEAKEIEEIEEQDIIDVLGDTNKGEDMKETHTDTENKIKEDFDMPFENMDDFTLSDNEFDKNILAEDLDVQDQLQTSQNNSILNLLNNTSIEGLKSLLDGMQLTINISFPDKKK